jgi:hypothetical protein
LIFGARKSKEKPKMFCDMRLFVGAQSRQLIGSIKQKRKQIGVEPRKMCVCQHFPEKLFHDKNQLIGSVIETLD